MAHRSCWTSILDPRWMETRLQIWIYASADSLHLPLLCVLWVPQGKLQDLFRWPHLHNNRTLFPGSVKIAAFCLFVFNNPEGRVLRINNNLIQLFSNSPFIPGPDLGRYSCSGVATRNPSPVSFLTRHMTVGSSEYAFCVTTPPSEFGSCHWITSTFHLVRQLNSELRRKTRIRAVLYCNTFSHLTA